MIFIAEGKKLGALYQDCRAVSEVYGQMLMISIVVLAFSGIAMTVYSDGGFVKPEHTPHVDLSEKIDTGPNTIQIVHSGGETIDFDKIKVILYVKSPNQPEFKQIFDMSDPLIAKDPLIVKVFDPEGNSKDISTDGVFRLGDSILIYTNSNKLNVGNRRDLQNEDLVSMFIVDIPSQQVIQKAVLQGGPWKLPYWITPHPYGSVYSSSDGWQPTGLVAEINDGSLTDSTIPQNGLVAENYTFGIDADEVGIQNSFTRVILRIIYQTHDNSPNILILKIFNGSQWTQIAPTPPETSMPQYSDIPDCVAHNPGEDTGETTYDITEYVKTISELEKLAVSFSLDGHASNVSQKTGWVDFVGIHVE